MAGSVVTTIVGTPTSRSAATAAPMLSVGPATTTAMSFAGLGANVMSR